MRPCKVTSSCENMTGRPRKIRTNTATTAITGPRTTSPNIALTQSRKRFACSYFILHPINPMPIGVPFNAGVVIELNFTAFSHAAGNHGTYAGRGRESRMRLLRSETSRLLCSFPLSGASRGVNPSSRYWTQEDLSLLRIEACGGPTVALRRPARTRGIRTLTRLHTGPRPAPRHLWTATIARLRASARCICKPWNITNHFCVSGPVC